MSTHNRAKTQKSEAPERMNARRIFHTMSVYMLAATKKFEVFA